MFMLTASLITHDWFHRGWCLGSRQGNTSPWFGHLENIWTPFPIKNPLEAVNGSIMANMTISLMDIFMMIYHNFRYQITPVYDGEKCIYIKNCNGWYQARIHVYLFTKKYNFRMRHISISNQLYYIKPLEQKSYLYDICFFIWLLIFLFTMYLITFCIIYISPKYLTT